MYCRLLKTHLFLLSLITILVVFCIPRSSFGYFDCATQQFNTTEFLTTIDNHILALRNKNIPKAYHAYTSDEFKKHTSFEEFQNLVKKYPALHSNIGIALDAICFQENVGYYQGVATASNGEKLVIKFHLTEERGFWKITTLQLYQVLCQQEKNPKTRISSISSKKIFSG